MLQWLTQNVGLLTTLVGIITIIAIILAPIIALRVQKKIEEFKEKTQRKLHIFKVLMATRAQRLASEHVQALNMIDLEFHENKTVIDSWKLYHDHLSLPSSEEPITDVDTKRWFEKGDELLIELLLNMSNVVGYSFDKVSLKRGIYSPKAHGELENDQYLLRKGLLAVIDGKKPISINLQNTRDK